jgi:hypothetical protein
LLAPSALAQANKKRGRFGPDEVPFRGIRNNKILPKEGEIHKAFFEAGD